jgi:glutamyl-tRNA reductase
VLGELGRLALRTGKRARAETAIGRAGLSLLSAVVELAAARLGPRAGDTHDPLSGRDVLVVGAGSMSGLATATAARSGAASITVANRTRKHAERLAASVSTVTTTVTGLADLPAAIAAADVVISCTGATGQVITGDMVSAALAARAATAAPAATAATAGTAAKSARGALVIMDLAMPRDVEPAVAGLPGVVLIGMDQLSEHAGTVRDDDVAAVRTILEAELAAYQSAMDAARVAPTVVALRAKAAGVVDAELARLAGRLSADDLSGHALDEIAQTVRRVVDKLLHAPTVRVKELAGSPGGEEYATALRVLFDLDPRAVEAVTRAAPEQEGSR